VVCVDQRCFCPAEVETPLGNASSTRKQSGWVPGIASEVVASEMVSENLDLTERDAMIEQEASRTLRYHDIAFNQGFVCGD
jgi:hypothetical protein